MTNEKTFEKSHGEQGAADNLAVPRNPLPALIAAASCPHHARRMDGDIARCEGGCGFSWNYMQHDSADRALISDMAEALKQLTDGKGA